MRFSTRRFDDLTDKELEQCAELYSNNYGKYSGAGGRFAKGQPIRMSASLYRSLYAGKPSVFISLCYSQTGALLGQAIFLRRNVEGKGLCSWVLQLVVHKRYRNRKIGSKLLQSAWGFSNYFAWGLATANAITLRTLEAVTWRQLSAEEIASHIDVVKDLMDDVPFVDKNSVLLSDSQSQIFSNFYPELEASNAEESLAIYAKKLGAVEPGYEWLAFTFASQPMTFSQEKLEQFLKFSDEQLKDAYSRMDMPSQAWARGAKSEVDFVVEHLGLETKNSIVDLGCGRGRHSVELSKRGFSDVTGVDFSERNIAEARRESMAAGTPAGFVVGDVRTLRLGRKFDVVLCLYDVIGSFRDNAENLKIIRTIKSLLKQGGRAVISVMNMELTRSIAINVASLSQSPEALLALPPSSTMAASGNVFKPEFYLVNEDDGLVYRKEQFDSDDGLSAEYVVADKRFTLEEISRKMESQRLKVVYSSFVQAGKWDKPLEATDLHAKEILLVVESV